jgi:hypothetical protein
MERLTILGVEVPRARRRTKVGKKKRRKAAALA